MLLRTRKSPADRFFVSLAAATVATAILWGGLLWNYPDFLSGLAAGLILGAALLMYANRNADEYTLATWHAGTSAGFAVLLLWLLATALAKGFDDSLAPGGSSLLADGRLVELTATSAFLGAIGLRMLRDRA